VSPFGIFIHHFPLPAPGTPLSQLTEPSQIFDFNGFVAGTRIRGGGIGTDTKANVTMPLAFQADMGFMTGQYLGQDGVRRHGTFGSYEWICMPVQLDRLYSRPSCTITTRISPRMDCSWTIAIPPEALEIDLDDATASMELSNVSVFDDHDLANSLTGGHGLASPPIPPIARFRQEFRLPSSGAA